MGGNAQLPCLCHTPAVQTMLTATSGHHLFECAGMSRRELLLQPAQPAATSASIATPSPWEELLAILANLRCIGKAGHILPGQVKKLSLLCRLQQQLEGAATSGTSTSHNAPTPPASSSAPAPLSSSAPHHAHVPAAMQYPQHAAVTHAAPAQHIYHHQPPINLLDTLAHGWTCTLLPLPGCRCPPAYTPFISIPHPQRATAVRMCRCSTQPPSLSTTTFRFGQTLSLCSCVNFHPTPSPGPSQNMPLGVCCAVLEVLDDETAAAFAGLAQCTIYRRCLRSPSHCSSSGSPPHSSLAAIPLNTFLLPGHRKKLQLAARYVGNV